MADDSLSGGDPRTPTRTRTPRHRALQDVVDAAQCLLDAAIVRHRDDRADETFLECRVCREWDSHTDDCPIPALQRWMDTP